jgi:transposase
MNVTTYGLDVAKSVFQLYWVDWETGEISNRKLGRRDLIDFLAQRPRGRIALEACGSAHWWARKLESLGHEVLLLHATYVRAFVRTNKTDAADARAIWTAANQPDMRLVASKTEDQQAMLALHRMRSLQIKCRTMQVNQLRGLLYEFGFVFRAGRKAGLAEIRGRMVDLENQVPGVMLGAIRDLLRRIDGVDEEIADLEQKIAAWHKNEAACQAVIKIPGIGRLSATALVATMGDPKAYKSGREFASFLGLVPTQNGTGGKVRLGAISKRGDAYLRTLLIQGARSVLFTAKTKTVWQEEIQARRPANVASVALANKIARTAWAILAHGRTYEKGYVSIRPA